MDGSVLIQMLALIKIPAHLGYLVLFGLIGAESAGVPLPGETALITAGVLWSHGRFHIELVIGASFCSGMRWAGSRGPPRSGSSEMPRPPRRL
jgi:membrane protein DedA with SNARE-associated domain